MKLPLCSCEAINDSTSLRNCSSPEHACEMNRAALLGAISNRRVEDLFDLLPPFRSHSQSLTNVDCRSYSQLTIVNLHIS